MIRTTLRIRGSRHGEHVLVAALAAAERRADRAEAELAAVKLDRRIAVNAVISLTRYIEILNARLHPAEDPK